MGQPLPVEIGAGTTITDLMSALATAASRAQTPEQTRSELGKLALDAPTVAEGDFIGAAVFAQLAGQRVAGVVPVHGDRLADRRAAGVGRRGRRAAGARRRFELRGPDGVSADDDRRRALHGRRHAHPAQRRPGRWAHAVIVVSCLALALPEGITDPVFDATAAQIEAELAVLRDGGAAVEIIGPGAEFLEVSGWGAELMNPARVAGAYEAGLRQAADEADRLRAIWTGQSSVS